MPTEFEHEDFHLSNAPIVEALIEIKLAEPLKQDSLEMLRSCAENLSSDYPVREDLLTQQVQVQFGSAASGSSITLPVGYLCKDSAVSSAHRVLQLRLDGFALSELKPYTRWADFYQEAQRLWKAYRQAVGGASAASWSIRYVNQISWPEGEKIEDYLNVYPEIPKGLPQSLTGCFMRLESMIDKPSEGAFTQQIFPVPSFEVGKVSFIVDHDFKFSAIGLSEKVLWERIESARDTKNKFFRATLTQKALGVYQ